MFYKNDKKAIKELLFVNQIKLNLDISCLALNNNDILTFLNKKL